MKKIAALAALTLTACGMAPPTDEPSPTSTQESTDSAPEETITVTSSGITSTVAIGEQITITTEFDGAEPHVVGPIDVSPAQLDDIKDEWAALEADAECSTNPLVHEPWADACSSANDFVATLTDIADDPRAFPGWLSLDYDPAFRNTSDPSYPSAIALERIPMALPLNIEGPTFETWERPYLMSEEQYGTFLWNLAEIASGEIQADTCSEDKTATFTISGHTGVVHESSSPICDYPRAEIGYSALTAHIAAIIDDPDAVQPARWDLPTTMTIQSADVVTTLTYIDDRIAITLSAPGREPIALEPSWQSQRWINVFTAAWASAEECTTYVNEPWHDTECAVPPEAIEILAKGWPHQVTTLPIRLQFQDSEGGSEVSITPPLVIASGEEHPMEPGEITDVLWASIGLTAHGTWDVQCDQREGRLWIYTGHNEFIDEISVCRDSGPLQEHLDTILDSIERRPS